MPRLFARRKLTGEKMLELEERIREENLSRYKNYEIKDLLAEAENLGLKVIVGDETLDGIRGELTEPPDDDSHKGILRLCANPNKFDILHELMHYLINVGVGNTVDRAYPEDYSSHRESEDANEREINYLSAAILMPLDEMKKRIREYDSKHLHLNLRDFIMAMQDDYGVTTDCVLMRIQEVRKQMMMEERGA